MRLVRLSVSIVAILAFALVSGWATGSETAIVIACSCVGALLGRWAARP